MFSLFLSVCPQEGGCGVPAQVGRCLSTRRPVPPLPLARKLEDLPHPALHGRVGKGFPPPLCLSSTPTHLSWSGVIKKFSRDRDGGRGRYAS